MIKIILIFKSYPEGLGLYSFWALSNKIIAYIIFMGFNIVLINVHYRLWSKILVNFGMKIEHRVNEKKRQSKTSILNLKVKFKNKKKAPKISIVQRQSNVVCICHGTFYLDLSR